MEVLSGAELMARMEAEAAEAAALQSRLEVAQEAANQALVAAVTAAVTAYSANGAVELLDVLARLLEQQEAGTPYKVRAELQVLYADALAARAKCIRLDAELQRIPARGRRVALVSQL